MKKTTIYAIVAAAIVLTGAIIFLLMPGKDPVEERFSALRESPVAVRPVDESVLADLVLKTNPEGGEYYETELTFEQIVALLRKKYGDKIANSYMQTRMLTELIRYLQAKYPEDWVARLQEILGAAFPDMATALFKMSENLYKFGKEHEAMNEDLAKMSLEERDAKVWALRRDIFGDAADEIWGAEKKSRSVQKTLTELSANSSMSFEDKASAYKSAIMETYGESGATILENHRQEYTNQFITAAQKDLAAYEPAKRREAYRYVWKEMGYDDTAIQRLDTLENSRDQRWSNGELYETERKSIEAQYSGGAREAKLDQLRVRLFPEEAEVIKSEEASGFYRFQRARTYGRN